MEAQKLEVKINVDSKDFEKKLKVLNEIMVEFGTKIKDINNTKIIVNVVQKIPKKWYQFWIKST